ncbi:fumarylacetoacetate hydrolase family protein, partial [Kineococcus indalonis]
MPVGEGQKRTRTPEGPDKQWWRAKGADGFTPLGPWIETELD